MFFLPFLWMFTSLWSNCSSASSLGIASVLVHEEEGAGVGNKVQTAVGMTEKALQEMTSVNLFKFIPEYTEYIGLESLGTNLNLL